MLRISSIPHSTFFIFFQLCGLESIQSIIALEKKGEFLSKPRRLKRSPSPSHGFYPKLCLMCNSIKTCFLLHLFPFCLAFMDDLNIFLCKYITLTDINQGHSPMFREELNWLWLQTHISGHLERPLSANSNHISKQFVDFSTFCYYCAPILNASSSH